MSSKRVLYKPAPESVKPVDVTVSRKPLTQGRLVSSVLPDSLTVFASPSSANQSAMSMSRESPVITSTYEGPVLEGQWTPPREVMASYHPVGRKTKPTPDHSSGRSPQSSLSSIPSSLVPQSPPKPSPSRALDLSDSEIEFNIKKYGPSEVKTDQGHDSVLMVDASGGKVDPLAAEVMVETGIVQSPAKVICHAPTDGQEPHTRDTGSVEAAARIPVDHVPSIVQTGDDNHSIVEGMVIGHGIVDEIPTRGPPAGSSAKTLALEDTEESALSDVSDSLALRDSLIGQGGNMEQSRVDPSTQSTKEKKKKKTARSGRIVPSRYMQSFTKTTGGATTRSKSATRTATNATKQAEKVTKKPPQKPPIPGSTVRTKRQRKSLAPFSETPMERGLSGKDMFTSTPALDGSFFPGHLSVNASAMSGVSNISAISHDMSVLREDPTADLGSKFDDTRDFKTMHKRGKKGDTHHQKELTQFDLDKMYARYIQWIFLASKMQRVRQEKEKEAMLQVYLLDEEVESLNEKKTELEMKLARFNHANNLDQLLDVQKSGLGPVRAHLKQFQNEYTTLAEALDTTRHQMRTVGVHLPQNEELMQDDLLTALSESEQLLTSIGSTLQDKTVKTSTFAKSLQALDKAVEAEDQELQRCQQLLARTSINTTHETSLRIQHIEGRIAE